MNRVYRQAKVHVMFKKLAAVFYQGLKTLSYASWFLTRQDMCWQFFEHFQKHSTKSMSLWTQNNGSNCERWILAYKKNKLCLISILYIKNTNEKCFIKR